MMLRFPGARVLSSGLMLLFLFSSIALAQSTAEVESEVSTDEVTATPSNDKFVYSPKGRRDPFEPLFPKEPVVGEIVKQTRPEKIRGPLERYELKQFRLMAILVVKGSPHAMVKAPDGKSYTVKVNDYIGLNGGVVKNIQTKVIDIDENGMRIEKSPDRIIVEETGVDSMSGQVIKENRYIVM